MSILISKSKLTQSKKKLAKATGALVKLRQYVPKKVLKSIYYAIFDYCQIWGQNFNTLLRDIEKL